jgi:hypothetical protein
MSFRPGAIVKNIVTVYGEVVEYNPQLTNQEPTKNPGHSGGPGARIGEQVEIPPNFTGEVLSSDNISTVAIYPIHSTGELEPHLIKVEGFTYEFKEAARHNPFIWPGGKGKRDPGRPVQSSLRDAYDEAKDKILIKYPKLHEDDDLWDEVETAMAEAAQEFLEGGVVTPAGDEFDDYQIEAYILKAGESMMPDATLRNYTEEGKGVEMTRAQRHQQMLDKWSAEEPWTEDNALSQHRRTQDPNWEPEVTVKQITEMLQGARDAARRIVEAEGLDPSLLYTTPLAQETIRSYYYKYNSPMINNVLNEDFADEFANKVRQNLWPYVANGMLSSEEVTMLVSPYKVNSYTDDEGEGLAESRAERHQRLLDKWSAWDAFDYTPKPERWICSRCDGEMPVGSPVCPHCGQPTNAVKESGHDYEAAFAKNFPEEYEFGQRLVKLIESGDQDSFEREARLAIDNYWGPEHGWLGRGANFAWQMLKNGNPSEAIDNILWVIEGHGHRQADELRNERTRVDRHKEMLDKWPVIESKWTKEAEFRAMPTGDDWFKAWGTDASSPWPELDELILQAYELYLHNPQSASRLIDQAKSMVQPLVDQQHQAIRDVFEKNEQGVGNYDPNSLFKAEAYMDVLDSFGLPTDEFVTKANRASAYLWHRLATLYQGYTEPTTRLNEYSHEDGQKMAEEILAYKNWDHPQVAELIYGDLEEVDEYLSQHKDAYPTYKKGYILQWFNNGLQDEVKDLLRDIMLGPVHGVGESYAGDDDAIQKTDRRVNIRKQWGVGERDDNDRLKWSTFKEAIIMGLTPQEFYEKYKAILSNPGTGVLEREKAAEMVSRSDLPETHKFPELIELANWQPTVEEIETVDPDKAKRIRQLTAIDKAYNDVAKIIYFRDPEARSEDEVKRILKSPFGEPDGYFTYQDMIRKTIGDYRLRDQRIPYENSTPEEIYQFTLQNIVAYGLKALGVGTEVLEGLDFSLEADPSEQARQKRHQDMLNKYEAPRDESGRIKWTKVAIDFEQAKNEFYDKADELGIPGRERQESIDAYNAIDKQAERANLYWADRIYRAKQRGEDTTMLQASYDRSVAKLRKLIESAPIDEYLRHRWLQQIDSDDLYSIRVESARAAGSGFYDHGTGPSGVSGGMPDEWREAFEADKRRFEIHQKHNVGERDKDGRLIWSKVAIDLTPDPLDEAGLQEVIDQQEVPWWNEDRATREQAVANALRVGMLSPLKLLKFNAVHYQDISQIPGDETDPKVYIEQLKRSKAKWDARGQLDLFSNPEEVDPFDPENSEAYAGFIHKHLEYIANVSAHIGELTDAAEQDLMKGGEGFHWRNAIKRIDLPGVNYKVAAFAWLLLAPNTSELGTIDSHMMRALDADEKMSQDPDGYEQLENELRVAKDKIGYEHMPLGKFQWGLWDYMRTPPDPDGTYHHQSHAAMRVLNPKNYKEVKWHKPINNSPIYGPREKVNPEWWEMTKEERMRAREEFEARKRRPRQPDPSIAPVQQPALFSSRIAAPVRVWWDFGDEDGVTPDTYLPEEIVDVPDNVLADEEFVADYLSNEYGWMVRSWEPVNVQPSVAEHNWLNDIGIRWSKLNGSLS